MNLLEAIEKSQATGRGIRRPGWQDGIIAYIEKGERGKYRKDAGGKPYLATAHVAACELAGVRLLSDITATDWELY